MNTYKSLWGESLYNNGRNSREIRAGFVFVLATDFGVGSPYIGQMQAALYRQAPDCPVINLVADLYPFCVQEAAYWLAAYPQEFPADSIFIGIVDPGVGGERGGVVLHADDRWFVGPDNGLFEVVARRASSTQWWDISWCPRHWSASFHGRDWFAPIAARIYNKEDIETFASNRRGPSFDAQTWPKELFKIVYKDCYGNTMTGLRASYLTSQAIIKINGRDLAFARTFCEVGIGQAFWYQNSNGLVEFAVNQGSASDMLGVKVGDCFEVMLTK